MGFVIISDTKLSTTDAFQALGRADKLEKACDSIPKSYFCRRNGLLNRTAFYMLCLNNNPYEYLIMTIAELDMTLKVSEEHDAPLDELCRMLARRNGDQDDDEDEQPDEADAAALNGDAVRPENGLPNNVDAMPRAQHPAAPVDEPGQQQPAAQNDAEPRNNPIEVIDEIEIEIVFENEVEFIPENEVGAHNDAD